MTHETSSLLQAGLRWFAEGRQVTVATVIKTWGSSPRPVGSLLLVSEQGDFVGSVSGGCIEGAVISAAQKTMRDGISQLLSFGVTQDMAWEVGLSCGGRIEIFVERADSSLIARLADSMTFRKPQLVVTELTEAPFSLATKLQLTAPDDPICPPFSDNLSRLRSSPMCHPKCSRMTIAGFFFNRFCPSQDSCLLELSTSPSRWLRWPRCAEWK